MAGRVGFALLAGLLAIAPANAGTVRGKPGEVPAIVAQALPAVVSITTRRIERGEFNNPVPKAAMGSGVIVDRRGYILTNEHVVRGAEVIKVTLTDGRTFLGSLVGEDRYTDLAVVKIDGKNLRALPMGESSRLRIGEGVVAIGSPLWIEGGPTVTVGVLSGRGRSMEEPDEPGQAMLHDLLQTDAAINPGNSGGPLLNLAGQIVGINTAVMESAHGIGFAIPIDNAKPVVRALVAGGRILRPSLGLVAVSLTPQLAFTNDYPVEQGVLVVRMEPGGPAEGAGLRPNDVILALGGEAVGNLHHLHGALFRRRPGDQVVLQVWRDGEHLSVTAVLREER